MPGVISQKVESMKEDHDPSGCGSAGTVIDQNDDNPMSEILGDRIRENMQDPAIDECDTVSYYYHINNAGAHHEHKQNH